MMWVHNNGTQQSEADKLCRRVRGGGGQSQAQAQAERLRDGHARRHGAARQQQGHLAARGWGHAQEVGPGCTAAQA